MLYTTEKAFVKKLLLAVLIVCIIPQIFCVGLRYINEYYIAENVDMGSASEIIDLVGSVIGTISSFSSYSIIIYGIFLFGAKGGGEWLIAVFAGYILVFFLVQYLADITFAIVLYIVFIALLLFFFLLRLKGPKSYAVLILLSTFLPYPGGIVIVFATSSVSGEDFAQSIVYGLMNFALDMVMLIVAEQIASFCRKSASDKQTDIVIGGQYTPKNKPIIKAILFTEIVNVAITLVGYIADTASELSSYGLPVNGTEWWEMLSKYLILAILTAISYFVSVFVANKLEDAYFACEDYSARLNRALKGKTNDVG